MYGYMLRNKKFYELGEIQLFHNEAFCYEWTIGCPKGVEVDLNDMTAMYGLRRKWYMPTEEGVVYKCSTVWLAKDNSKKAKKLFKKAVKDRYNREIKDATLKYKNALSCLK